ncbi:hypothetical protein CUMW_186000 [Citrus unshiu]|uniref:VOC domain-containing protein n=1 Tax=Citrus sinensis TaxID=2711 RepID=A0A067G4I9_CITSI|nr:hypothetical protein CISIN_1g036856mg [Citrus sinensis]GAY58301.1 hypothetical protein CUMW_186000 [Citrus unshiu]
MFEAGSLQFFSFGMSEAESLQFLSFGCFLLVEKGIQTFQRSLPDGKVKQVFFFDPDGNGLEVASRRDE